MYRVSSFGESHGKGLGVVIDGLPSGLDYDESTLLDFLARRRPGGDFVSSRAEADKPNILSGIYENKFLGTPVACIFKNTDTRSEDYKNLQNRKGHADEVWEKKFEHQDKRGGGRSSGRETLSRVVAGAFAKMALKKDFPDLEIKAVTSSIFNIKQDLYDDKDFFEIPKSDLGFLDKTKNKEAQNLLAEAKKEGQSYGGRVELRVFNPPKSLGQPVFGKIKSNLASAALSIGAVKSFSLGDDVDLSLTPGTDFHSGSYDVYGGINGGITSGKTLKFFVDVKPTSSILDVSKKGRHDPCIVPRVLVVLESMVYMVFMDMWLQRKAEI